MITRSVLFERFAGRRVELDHVTDAIAASRRSQTGATILISGEAGVGKSRFISEIARAAAGDGDRFIRVRCEELPAAYAPLVRIFETLRQVRTLRQNDALARALELLTNAHSNATLDDPDRRHVILGSLVAAIGAAARKLGHLTLAIDDAHWSDRSSLEAMRLLARVTRTLPIVLIVAYRAEDLETDHVRALAIAAIEREGADRVRLGALDFDDVSSLLRDLIPEASKKVLRRIYDLSEGKPYVAEELARSAVERGFDAGPETALTLRGAVLERTARLTSEHRDIVDRAAVLGRNFASEDLSAFGARHADIVAALRGALDLQLVEERQVGGRPWFRFRHALTREILYRNLLNLERRALHATIANHLEGDDQRLAELAYHRSEAGDARAAVDANERAGDRAVGIAAIADAAKLFARALQFPCDAPTLGRLAVKLAKCLDRLGDAETIETLISPLFDRLAACGRSDEALEIATLAIRPLARTRSTLGTHLCDRALALIGPQTPHGLRFGIEISHAQLLRAASRDREALDACTRAETHLAFLDSRERKALYLSKAYTYLRLHDMENAAAQIALREAEPMVDDPRVEADSSALRATIAYRLGHIRKAFELSLETAARWTEALNERAAFYQRCNAAMAAADLGDFAFVRVVLEEARREGMTRPEALEVAFARQLRATGGDPSSVSDLFERVLEAGPDLLRQTLGRDLPYIFGADRDRARSIAMRALRLTPSDAIGDLAEAIADVGDRSEIDECRVRYEASDVDLRDPWCASAHELWCARIARVEGRFSDATAHARAGLVLADRMEHWVHMMDARELLGDVAGAREVLIRIGATAELERFDIRHRVPEAQPRISLAALTQRERQVARMIAEGLPSRTVAERLAIAPRTVETHLSKLYAKLGVNSRAELATLLNPSNA